MSILLLPFKIVFLIVAFILKGVLYLLAFILNFISEVLVALQYILGSVFVLVAIGGTIVLVRNIQNGSLTGLQGGVLIGFLWLISMAFSMMFYLSSAAADLFESIGDWLGDTALGFFLLEIGQKRRRQKDSVLSFTFSFGKRLSQVEVSLCNPSRKLNQATLLARPLVSSLNRTATTIKFTSVLTENSCFLTTFRC